MKSAASGRRYFSVLGVDIGWFVGEPPGRSSNVAYKRARSNIATFAGVARRPHQPRLSTCDVAHNNNTQSKLNTHFLQSGSTSANFSNTFISSFAASLYFSTFLIIFRAILCSLEFIIRYHGLFLDIKLGILAISIEICRCYHKQMEIDVNNKRGVSCQTMRVIIRRRC